jgi:hypothetical protein
MEFETPKAATMDDIIRADTPRVTLQPLHANVEPDPTEAPRLADAEAAETVFDFETESTAAAALSSTKLTDHPHHTVAVFFAGLVVLMFGGALLAIYLMR